MALFLQSIQPIIPDPGSFKSRKSSPTATVDYKSVPSAFVEEIETLRTRVEELSDEVSGQRRSSSMPAPNSVCFSITASEAEGRALDSHRRGQRPANSACECLYELLGEFSPRFLALYVLILSARGDADLE